MQKVTLYVAEAKNHRNRWQVAKRTESEAEATEALKHWSHRPTRVRKVKAIKLEVGDRITARAEIGYFSDLYDEYRPMGYEAISGVVAPGHLPGTLRVNAHTLQGIYVINGKAPGLIDVKID